MRIGNRIIGKGYETLMFAEEGQANQGNFEIAIDMCKKASFAEADGIEFQLFLADDMYVHDDSGYTIYKNRELSSSQIKELIAFAHELGLLFQVAGLSPKIIELCAAEGADVFCVNATDLTNPVIIDAVASTGKPFWLATLMGTMEEIDWAVNYAISRARSDIGLLHGQHVMSSDTTKGVPPELLQLDCIDLFKQRYGLVTGFVDHTSTLFVPSIAAAKGADLVMKHLAPEKQWQGPDWVVCLDPGSWREAKFMFDYTALSNGASKELSQAEFKDRSIHRRSIHTSLALTAGSKIVSGDLVALRPGKGGIDPRVINTLIGREVTQDLPEQHQLRFDDLLPNII